MRFVDFIWGPTFFCKKKLFELILFDDINKGEDTKFISKCIRMNKKIFATDERDFVYIRDPILNQTCKNSLKKILGKNYEIVHKKFI